MADPYKGERVASCAWCSGAGRSSDTSECDGCAGTGVRRQCRRAECQEHGCGGYGTCYAQRREATTAIIECAECVGGGFGETRYEDAEGNEVLWHPDDTEREG